MPISESHMLYNSIYLTFWNDKIISMGSRFMWSSTRDDWGVVTIVTKEIEQRRSLWSQNSSSLVCGGGHNTWQIYRTVHMNCTQFNFLFWILYYNYVRWNCVMYIWIFSILCNPLQLPMNLQLFQYRQLKKLFPCAARAWKHKRISEWGQFWCPPRCFCFNSLSWGPCTALPTSGLNLCRMLPLLRSSK